MNLWKHIKKVGVRGCKWIKLVAFTRKLFASISSLIVVIMVLLNELIGLGILIDFFLTIIPDEGLSPKRGIIKIFSLNLHISHLDH